MVSRVIAIGPPKEAALYFDQVLPVDLSRLVSGSENASLINTDMQLPHGDGGLVKVLKSLADGDASVFEAYLVQLRAMEFSLESSKIYVENEIREYKNFYEEVFLKSQYRPFIEEWAENAGEGVDTVHSNIALNGVNAWRETESKILSHMLLSAVGSSTFHDAPVWTTWVVDRSPPDRVLPNDEDYALTLRDLNLIDPSKISWEKVVEFRRDADAKARLRDFRLLFHEDFKGKGKAYIEDRISQGLENHERTAKEWSFELADRSLSIVGSKENLFASGLAIATSALAGLPLSVAATAGFAMSFAKAGLELRKVVKQRQHVLATGYRYVSDLKKLENT